MGAALNLVGSFFGSSLDCFAFSRVSIGEREQFLPHPEAVLLQVGAHAELRVDAQVAALVREHGRPLHALQFRELAVVRVTGVLELFNIVNDA